MEQIQALLARNKQIEDQLALLRNQMEQQRRIDTCFVPMAEKFSFKSTDWEFWLAAYERYRTVTAVSTLPQGHQINQLLLAMGPNVDKIFVQQNKPVTSFTTYNEVTEFFTNLYKKKNNIIFERAQFNARNQREGETAEEYIDEIIRLAETCNYGALNDDLVRDKLVVGILDVKLSERLQLDEELTMQKPMEKIKQAEEVKRQNKTLRQQIPSAINIERVYKPKDKWKKGKMEQKETTNSNKCTRCGIRPWHPTKNVRH